MYMATIIFCNQEESRETLVFASTISEIFKKIQMVKKIIAKHNLIFTGSVVEKVNGSNEAFDSLDFMSPNGTIH